MRRIEALRAHCADDPANIDEVTLRGAKLAVHHLARIRERDRSVTRHAPDYPGQQDEISEVATYVFSDPGKALGPRPAGGTKMVSVCLCAI